MSFEARLQTFKARVIQLEGYNSTTWGKPAEMMGASNGPRLLEYGLQLGVTNMEKYQAEKAGVLLLTMLRLPPGDEAFMAVFVKTGMSTFHHRLKVMLEMGAAADGSAPSADDEDEEATAGKPLKFAKRNNNTAIHLGTDGSIGLINKGHWSAATLMKEGLQPFIPADRVVVAVCPREGTTGGVGAQEFVQYLRHLVGGERLTVLRDVWETTQKAPPFDPLALPVTEIAKRIEKLGGHYPLALVQRLHVALHHLPTKHFVILAGISGTGKTSVVAQYAKAIHGIFERGAADPFYFRCAVRPNWTDPSELTGYFDVFSSKYIVPDFLQAVLTAEANPAVPVFVCIDEMNLARVEYYFADVLSGIESDHPELRLHNHETPLPGSNGQLIKGRLHLPANLYIVGTINVDESTQSISDKVLDRANLIDMSQVDLDGFQKALADREPDLKPSIDQCLPLLTKIAALLLPHRLGFGYRVATEFVRYHAFAVKATPAPALPADLHKAILDDLVCQKILVKLRGNENQRPMLEGLMELLEEYPRSLAILTQLQEDLNETRGFQYAR